MSSDITSKLFVHEEVESDTGYFSGYKGPGSIADQLAKLRKLFPQIGGVNEELVASIERSDVKLSTIPKRFPEEDRHFWCIPHWTNFGITYCEAIAKVLEVFGDKIDDVFGDKIYDALDISSDTTSGHLKQTERKINMINKILLKQDADILIIEAQFGLRHRGRTMRRACVVMGEDEFGLGIYEILIMLLLSPERLAYYNDLWIDVAGDEWCSKIGRRSNYAPRLLYDSGDLIHLVITGIAVDDNAAGRNSGTVSAFIMQ